MTLPCRFHRTPRGASVVAYALLWLFYGAFIVLPWCCVRFHGASMAVPWWCMRFDCFHGVTMVLSWETHGTWFHRASIARPWCFHGGVCASMMYSSMRFFMVLRWPFRMAPMGRRGCFHGIFMVLPCYFYGTFMVLLWCFHGVSMVLSWYSHEIPWCFHGIPWYSHGASVLQTCRCP